MGKPVYCVVAPWCFPIPPCRPLVVSFTGDVDNKRGGNGKKPGLAVPCICKRFDCQRSIGGRRERTPDCREECVPRGAGC